MTHNVCTNFIFCIDNNYRIHYKNTFYFRNYALILPLAAANNNSIFRYWVGERAVDEIILCIYFLV